MYDAKVLFPGEIDRTVAELDPRAYPLRFLAEGDSWFSFGSWKFSSLLNQLRLTRPSAVVTLAHPGETISRMASIAQNPELDLWLSMPYSDIRWSALLVSGGGNDVIDAAQSLIPASPSDQPLMDADRYIDQVRLGEIIAVIQQSYADIVALRDRPNSPCIGVPLITHAYDLATPRNAPAQFLVPLMGPWLYPAMVRARIPTARWNAVSDFILGALGQCLVEPGGAAAEFPCRPDAGDPEARHAGKRRQQLGLGQRDTSQSRRFRQGRTRARRPARSAHLRAPTR
jgi:hypothetical protein